MYGGTFNNPKKYTPLTFHTYEQKSEIYRAYQNKMTSFQSFPNTDDPIIGW